MKYRVSDGTHHSTRTQGVAIVILGILSINALAYGLANLTTDEENRPRPDYTSVARSYSGDDAEDAKPNDPSSTGSDATAPTPSPTGGNPNTATSTGAAPSSA